MGRDHVPQRWCCVVYQLVYILECADGKEIRVNIILYDLFDHADAHVAPFKTRQEVRCLQKRERAVVMTVVSAEPVRHWSLR